jgi:phthiocerol/phenolphthiocerol synthesis type-I polyketide synthase C
LRKALEMRTGFKPLAAESALETLDRLIGAGHEQCASMDLDWSVVRRSFPGAKAARFAEILADIETASTSDVTRFRERICGMDLDGIKPLVERALREQVGKVLRISPEKIDSDLSLQEMGMDSLMAVELALEIERYFEIPFSSMSATAAGNLRDTSARISGMLLGNPWKEER